MDLVVVGDGADDLDGDVAVVVEGADVAVDADVVVRLDLVFGALVGLVCVYEFLAFDYAGAVVDFEVDVCLEAVYLADLGHEGHLKKQN